MVSDEISRLFSRRFRRNHSPPPISTPATGRTFQGSRTLAKPWRNQATGTLARTKVAKPNAESSHSRGGTNRPRESMKRFIERMVARSANDRKWAFPAGQLPGTAPALMDDRDRAGLAPFRQNVPLAGEAAPWLAIFRMMVTQRVSRAARNGRRGWARSAAGPTLRPRWRPRTRRAFAAVHRLPRT